jgi:hypothetical protein
MTTGASCPWNLSTVPIRAPGMRSAISETCALYGATIRMSFRVAEKDTRNAKYVVLHTDLEHLMGYVQQVADANPANAQSLIESAGFAIRKTASRPKSAIKIEAGDVPGAVKLIAKAVASRASYEWQYSTDQKTWTNAPSTLQAKTTITGLTSGTVYYFRFRGVTKTGETAFSQLVQILVS